MAVPNTSRRAKEKDLLFIEQDFTLFKTESQQNSKKNFIQKLKRIEQTNMSQTRQGFNKVKTPSDAMGQPQRGKMGMTQTFVKGQLNLNEESSSKQLNVVAPYIAQINASEALQHKNSSKKNLNSGSQSPKKSRANSKVVVPKVQYTSTREDTADGIQRFMLPHVKLP